MYLGHILSKNLVTVLEIIFIKLESYTISDGSGRSKGLTFSSNCYFRFSWISSLPHFTKQ